MRIKNDHQQVAEHLVSRDPDMSEANKGAGQRRISPLMRHNGRRYLCEAILPGASANTPHHAHGSLGGHDSFTVKRLTTVMVACFAIIFTHAFPLRAISAEQIDFENDVLPILEDNCLFCHGEDESESGLRLDRRGFMLRGGDSGLAAVAPNDSAKSYLIEVINHVDPDMAMPPDEEKLPEEDIEILTKWIEQGAIWPGQMDDVAEVEIDHWAFLPRQTEFSHDSIDEFLIERLAKEGLEISAQADPRSLIRRVSVVLTGLAPTPEETRAFIDAFGQDSDEAYEALVERLLASPHFGERWAQHWLDVIRWAETNGSESNLYRKNAWMYRDYVARSFNEDKSYQDFVREQLAGDSLGAGDATGFLVAGPHVPAATVGQVPSAIRQARADRMDEIVQTVGASVMGVTVGCARCHNHKFDPISIQDYYSMTAAFQDVEFGSRYPELSEDHPRVEKEKRLLGELDGLRGEMRANGWAWVEDWKGYDEIHVPPRLTENLRIVLERRWNQLDELTVLDVSIEPRELSSPEYGTKVSDNSKTRVDGFPATRLVDGEFSAKGGWRGTSPKGEKDLPWVQFDFDGRVELGAIRLSSNRQDFLQTDYLLGIGNRMYGDVKLQVLETDGTWTTFASTAAMKKRSKENQERKAIQEQIQRIIEALVAEGPQPAFLAEFVDPVDTFILARGSPESPRDQVFVSAPSNLGGEIDLPANSPGAQRRLAFAEWLVDEKNPLTARVMANRIWHHIFGAGIVATPSDFGIAGARPTHSELLDWMAGQFIESGYSMKEMIRMIVTSKAFRQSSRPNEPGMTADASASLLWRFPPRRVEAEVIRDSVLLASGRLDPTIGGPSYRIHNVKKKYAQWEVVDNHSDSTWRRMLYQERMRRVDDRIFTAFDFPDCGQIRAKRPVSTTPLQALNLMNSDFVVSQAELLADRAVEEGGSDIVDQVNRCFELLLSRQPSANELAASVQFANEQSLALLCRTLINTNEFAFLP
ncbi:MAG: PSD1 and planctomycete cytochrome C domain-containing protein [Planctomycetota bacterium]